jgi:uncharacterized membrane protein YdbT with pleckstrin-like domain
MADLVIHPTRKWLKLQYTTVFVIVCLSIFVLNNYVQVEREWVLLIPALLFLWPIAGSIGRRFTRMTISGDKLRYETGILSRTCRTIQLTKVQGVSVNQSFSQRLMGIGTLWFETAGETTQLSMANVDDPQGVADRIIEVSQAQQPKRKGERA